MPSGRTKSSESNRLPAPPGAFEDLIHDLDRLLINYLLADSLRNFLELGQPYPFVDMRELKPGAAGAGMPEQEVMPHHHGLILAIDGQLPPECKKHIRFKDKGRVVRENLAGLIARDPDLEDFELGWTLHGRSEFERLLKRLIWVDFGMLLQHDPRTTRRTRFALTHYRVRIDWPIEDAAESLARELRYVERHLYEHGENKAEQLESKLYERYGFHHTVGGRRTAAIVAGQYLRRLHARGKIGDFRLYVGSAEARTLTVISPGPVVRYALIRLSSEDLTQLAVDNDGSRPATTHLLHRDTDQGGVGVLRVVYDLTEHARRSKALRPVDSLVSQPFLRVESQDLICRHDTYAPDLPFNVVYTRTSED